MNEFNHPLDMMSIDLDGGVCGHGLKISGIKAILLDFPV
jgi:hypothetical protein